VFDLEDVPAQKPKSIAGGNAAVLEMIRNRADEAGHRSRAYISMAFGNPYGDMWSGRESRRKRARAITGVGVSSLSLADTIGALSQI